MTESDGAAGVSPIERLFSCDITAQLLSAAAASIHIVTPDQRTTFAASADADTMAETCLEEGEADTWFRRKTLALHAPENKAPIGTVIVRHDISEQVRAERRVNDILTFVAETVHDMRTHLTAIIGFSEVMTMAPWGNLGDEHYRGYANHIHTAGTYLLTQVNQLLDLSKIEAQRQELKEDEVDLAELLRQCGAAVGDMALRRGLHFSMDPDRTMPPLRLDPGLTRRVVMNLLSNAIKFTPEDGRVAVLSGIDGEGCPFLVVRDSGIGIAAENLSKVMEPFTQVRSPQSEPHFGSGLGLALSKRFMELQGGSLHLESQPDHGTTAIARFPAHRIVR